MNRFSFALWGFFIGGLCGIFALSWAQRQDAKPIVRKPTVLTRVLDTLPTGTIVVCYTHDQALACVLDPAMEAAQ